ncbi:hypothetical protein [Mesorhizobium sp. M0208]|uniref:hypothetical protein n=1 Tax=Mesorhizobium sp. M0208 TaxID=2956916 RepID=UPI003339795E
MQTVAETAESHLSNAPGTWNRITRLRICSEKVDQFLPLILAKQLRRLLDEQWCHRSTRCWRTARMKRLT